MGSIITSSPVNIQVTTATPALQSSVVTCNAQPITSVVPPVQSLIPAVQVHDTFPSSSVRSATNTTPSQSSQLPQQPPPALFTPSFLYEIKTRSNNSRTLFAMNLIRHLYDEETMSKTNVAGKCGKKQYNPAIIKEIKTACFQVFPLERGEIELVAWKKCHQAIDECGRRLNRKK